MALIYTIPQNHVVLIKRFGKHSRVQRDGLRFKLPFIESIKKVIGNKYALQGNLDVNILKEEERIIVKKVDETLKKYNSKTGHIFNLGHGVLQQTPVDNVIALVDAVHEISSR